jgi:hypothetical protein
MAFRVIEAVPWGDSRVSRNGSRQVAFQKPFKNRAHDAICPHTAVKPNLHTNV